MTADQLKALRKQLRYTQAELVSILGVRTNTVYRWEAGIHPISPFVAAFLEGQVPLHKRKDTD